MGCTDPRRPSDARRLNGAYSPCRTRNDAELRDEIRDRLIKDERVDANQVDVEAHDGVVTLRGIVDALPTKRAAGEDARDTPGVVDVSNLLRIREPAPIGP